MYFAGVDIGSTTTKCVIIDENDELQTFAHIMTGFNRDASGNEVLELALGQLGIDESALGCIVSTGYGRKAFKKAHKDEPEIIAHAAGTVHLYPRTRTIIDIGGQDSKVIDLDENGLVTKFEMNDKCAAGTGRFFEVLTHRLLGIEMDELEGLILQSENPIQISSMCTIFAESEIISHLSENASVADIAAGVAFAIAKRIIAQGRSGRIPYNTPIVFSGGPAMNKGIAHAFEKLLGKPVQTIADPQSTAAMGAALQAHKEFRLQNKGH